jgi:hypothetical protein
MKRDVNGNTEWADTRNRDQKFIAIAIWICRDGWDGGDGSAKPHLRRLYEDRVAVEDRRVIEAISIVTRVGWMEEIAGEWTDLCTLCRLSPDESRDRARRLKNSPGFVAVGGRYFYVTPGRLKSPWKAFRSFIEPDPNNERFPHHLRVFFNRVAGVRTNPCVMPCPLLSAMGYLTSRTICRTS